MGQILGHSQYSCYVADPFGVRLGDASSFVSLKYSRVVNDVGTATIVLPVGGPKGFDTNLLRLPDGRLEIWRRLPGSSREYLDTETIWLMKKRTFDRDARGRVTVTIEADTPLCLLREPGRFANYTTAAAAATLTDQLDDMCKSFVNSNIGSGVSSARSLAGADLSALISIAPDLSLAPSDTKSVAWRECLKVLREIADSSAQRGTYLAFDIVAPTPDTLQFRTYIGQRGVDHRFPNGQNPVIIGSGFGNMGECSLATDWRGEITYALAAGRGDGAFRLTASSQDATRSGMSPFGYREKFVNAPAYSTVTGLSAEAQAAVRAGRPRTIFKGRILDVPDTRYGVHWGWGDYVTVQEFGQGFDARIDAVEVTIDRGKESINAWVRGDL